MAPEAQTTKDTKKTNAAPPAADTTAITPPPETTALAEFDYGDDAGKGFENQDMSFRKLPMLVVLQSNSPQVVESRGKVHAGQIYNTVTGEVFDEVVVVPAVLDSWFLQFVPRDDGGGFRGRHKPESKIVKDAKARNDGRFGKLPFPQPNDPKTGKPQPDHELVETYEMYAITTQGSDVTGFAVIPFQSTKIKVLRGWNTQISMFAPKLGTKQFRPKEIPMYAHLVKMTTEVETNAKGTYFIPVLSPAMGGDDLVKSLIPRRDDPRYQAGKQLNDEVVAGLAKAAYETMEQEPAQDPESGVPF